MTDDCEKVRRVIRKHQYITDLRDANNAIAKLADRAQEPPKQYHNFLMKILNQASKKMPTPWDVEEGIIMTNREERPPRRGAEKQFVQEIQSSHYFHQVHPLSISNHQDSSRRRLGR